MYGSHPFYLQINRGEFGWGGSCCTAAAVAAVGAAVGGGVVWAADTAGLPAAVDAVVTAFGSRRNSMPGSL
jgi:hypothetical protein